MTLRRNTNRVPFTVAFTPTMGLAMACGTSIQFEEDDDSSACEPNEAVTCTCANGDGVQTCFADGSGFTSCNCGGTGGTGGMAGVGPGATTATTNAATTNAATTTGPTTVGPGTTTVGPSSTTVGPGPTTSTMMNFGICGSGLTTGSDGEDACLTASCCASFNACSNDIDCQACLSNAQAPGCDTNGLLGNFTTCSDTNCPTDVCDDGITFNDANADPAFACIACASDPGSDCCQSLDTCVGGGTIAEVTNCLTCLNDSSVTGVPPMAPTVGACFNLGSTIYNAAVGFQTCLNNNCSLECG